MDANKLGWDGKAVRFGMDTAFDWFVANRAPLLIVAALLQFFTALGLLFVTWTYTRTSRRQANIAAEAIRLQKTPSIALAQPYDYWGYFTEGLMSEWTQESKDRARRAQRFHLVNLGSGPVWITGLEATAWTSDNHPPLLQSGLPHNPLLRPGELIPIQTLPLWYERTTGSGREVEQVSFQKWEVTVKFRYGPTGMKTHTRQFSAARDGTDWPVIEDKESVRRN